MESTGSLVDIESDNITLDQSELVEGLPFSLGSLETFTSPEEEIVLEDVQHAGAGLKRSHEENIQQSKILILSQESPLVTFNLPTATSSQPRLENNPGLYGFSASFRQLEQSARNKHWEFSPQLNKLFIDLDRWVMVEFTAPVGFFIRALPVFSLPSDISQPVKRCPGHAAPSDKTNKNFPYPDHLIRVEGEDPVYQEDPTSGRLSVLFPVQASRLLKFMCLGSDLGGINRRPVKLVFTLEDGAGLVLGRQVFGLRLCSSPKRDKLKEEGKYCQQEETARNIAHRSILQHQ